MPASAMPSWGVALKVPDAGAFAARLRQGSPSVFGRVDGDQVVLDVRTVTDDQLSDIARAVLYAIEGDDLDED
jgi:L-seryl-tRNA(Ser) seleniumtransferase